MMGAVGIFLPGTLLIFFLIRIWDQLKQYQVVKASLEGINAVSAGLVCAAAILLWHPLPTSATNVGMVVGTFLVLLTDRVPGWALVGAAGVGGAVGLGGKQAGDGNPAWRWPLGTRARQLNGDSLFFGSATILSNCGPGTRQPMEWQVGGGGEGGDSGGNTMCASANPKGASANPIRASANPIRAGAIGWGARAIGWGAGAIEWGASAIGWGARAIGWGVGATG
jgi:hypothetical protein